MTLINKRIGLNNLSIFLLHFVLNNNHYTKVMTSAVCAHYYPLFSTTQLVAISEEYCILFLDITQYNRIKNQAYR